MRTRERHSAGYRFQISQAANAKILSKDADSYPYMYRNYPFLRPWVDSLRQADALKDTFIINPHGIQLHAYYVAAPKPTDKTAVIVHGYTDNAIRMFMIGYLYNRDLGYNILLPDLQQFHPYFFSHSQLVVYISGKGGRKKEDFSSCSHL